jgi:hypothetical protein
MILALPIPALARPSMFQCLSQKPSAQTRSRWHHSPGSVGMNAWAARVPPPCKFPFGSPSRAHRVEPKLVAEIAYLTWRRTLQPKLSDDERLLRDFGAPLSDYDDPPYSSLDSVATDPWCLEPRRAASPQRASPSRNGQEDRGQRSALLAESLRRAPLVPGVT